MVRWIQECLGQGKPEITMKKLLASTWNPSKSSKVAQKEYISQISNQISCYMIINITMVLNGLISYAKIKMQQKIIRNYSKRCDHS